MQHTANLWRMPSSLSLQPTSLHSLVHRCLHAAPLPFSDT